jgi:hypothetical protein
VWGRVRGLVVAAFFLAEPLARADEPPIVIEPPAPDPPPKPGEKSPEKPAESPVVITMPLPPPPASASAPPPPPAPVEPPKPDLAQRRKTITELGVGVTYFGAIQRSRVPSQAGVVFQAAPRFPIGDHFGIGLRFAYGLTGWSRMEDVTHAGYSVGKWTTHAYRDVWSWVGEGDKDDEAGRGILAFFGSIFLVAPLVLAGALYAVSPLAASSYAETDLTFDWEPADDPKAGPYLKGGIGLMAYVHPDNAHLYGGLGPNAGFGYRADNVSVGLVGTFLPYGAHGGTKAEHVLNGALTVSLVR